MAKDEEDSPKSTLTLFLFVMFTSTAEELKALLKPCPPEIMEAVKVSTKVNNVKYEGAEVLGSIS